MIGGVTSAPLDLRAAVAAANPRNAATANPQNAAGANPRAAAVATDMQTTGATVGVASITALRYAQSDGYNVVMPVRPAQAILASFRHIQVLPDSRLQDGVPLYKLRILDTLIDQLAAVHRGFSPGDVKRSSGVSSEAVRVGGAGGVDRLIGDLARGLRSAEAAAFRGSGGSAYRAGFLPLPGAFVDLVA